MCSPIEQSVAPRVEFAAGIDGDKAECVVSIIACAGDWFGGWDGLTPGSVDKFITADGKGGRLVEVIKTGEPAIMIGHWPGMYFNGDRVGFKIFQGIVKRLNDHYDNLIWMKNSEIARYWAARELTRIDKADNKITFKAPYACPGFTVRIAGRPTGEPKVVVDGKPTALKEVSKPLDLKPGTWVKEKEGVSVCFDLRKGESAIEW